MFHMKTWNVKESNLNLLFNFKALIEERSITRAGQRMFLGQSAMSRVLDRLQKMFQDELLVRTPTGYEPTHRALEIYADLEELLPKLEQLFRGNEFNPTEATDCFRIAATDFGAAVILPGLIKVLEIAAPKIQLEVTSLDEDIVRRIEK